MAYTSSEKFLRITISDHGRHQPFLDHITLIHRTIKRITTERAITFRHKHWQCLPESIEPADCDGLCEDCDEEGEAGCVRFQQVEDVETALYLNFIDFFRFFFYFTGVTQVIATA